MTQTKLKRTARAMKVVEKHTRTRDRITLMDVVEDSLARRASLAAEIAVIDAQLGKVYDRLAADIPVRVADPTPEGLALVSDTKPAPSRPRPTTSRDVTSPVTADTRARVREAIAQLQPVSLRRLANHLGLKPESLQYHLKAMRISGEVIASGATLTRAFSLAGAKQPPQTPRAAQPQACAVQPAASTAAPARRTVVDDGVEFEPVWSPGKSAPSLLGDRTQRAGGAA